jgi:predicted nucleic acid-binding protein
LQKSVTGYFAQVLPITEGISESAVRLIERYSLSHRPDTNDVLIAATALSLQETLVTGNRKHFDFIPGLDLKIFRP